jgi:hypothetical protein
VSAKSRKNRARRGAPWAEQEDERLLAIAHRPPRVIATLMERSWLACRRRLAYLRADGSEPEVAPAGRSSNRP